MKYNLIGIDPSIISTGMVVNGKVFNYCRNSEAIKTNLEYTKWFDLCKDEITYKYIIINSVDGYSENEVHKLRLYNAVTDMVMSDVLDNMVPHLPVKVAIEGYSYSSSVGDILDLVTFSTLMRNKLLMLTNDVYILSPTTLKLESCKMTYPPIDVGKKKPKLEYRNVNGTAGGSFTKTDMFMSLVDNQHLADRYCAFLRKEQEQILSTKTIKKPLEDCNDAYLLYLYLLNNHGDTE